MTTRASGPFEVEMKPLVPHDEALAGAIGRFSLEKRYHGDLDATSSGEMLSAGKPGDGSAGYVAIEQVRGTLGGCSGSFALLHRGFLRDGEPDLEIGVVPASGGGDLAGLAGHMRITIADGRHSYDFEYDFGESG
jgi:hypothetical protein